MLPAPLDISRLVLLVLLAVLLGSAILWIDQGRRVGDVAAAAVVASPTPGAVAPTANAAAPPAQLPVSSGAQGSQPPGDLAGGGGPVPAPAPAPAPAPTEAPVQRRGGVVCSEPHRLVQVAADAVVRATPGGRVVGTLPASSKYLGQSMTAWVQAVSADGRWGKVSVPWQRDTARAGWIALEGLAGRTTATMVVADLSERRVRVFDGCEEVFSISSAVGRPGSPSPTGRFWVTDRIAVPAAQRGSFGSYAFGLSTIQPNLPAGWTGGDQMAIHGTGAPGSIGQAASAGCLRVGEDALARLKPLLRAGTPVVIRA